MTNGLEALPPSQVGPPQDLKSLATWLHFANGIASKRRTVTQTVFTRTLASDGGTFPGETYVAAFAVDGLESRLFYHYSPREFALRKLREGAETLARLTAGRPDTWRFSRPCWRRFWLSSIFAVARLSANFGKWGYRNGLHDVRLPRAKPRNRCHGPGHPDHGAACTSMTQLHANSSARVADARLRAQAEAVPRDGHLGGSCGRFLWNVLRLWRCK